MKQLSKLLLIAIAAIFSGCVVQSLHPLYTKDDLVYEPKLIGRWVDPENDDESWSFAKSEGHEHRYDVVYTDNGKPGHFHGHVVKLDGVLYLDLLPIPDDDGNALRTLGLFPIHIVFKLRTIEPRLEMDLMDFDWLTEQLEIDPAMLRHERVDLEGDSDPDDRQILITASTKDLQSFVIKQAANPDAWDQGEPLVRTTSVDLR